MTNTMSAPADRLLLVDDNPTNLQVLFQALEQEGYELLIAESGEEALEIAGAARPQLILLDINMPGIDGYETCRRLKADPDTRNSVVIFLSARGDVDDKVQGLSLGAVDYIGKPFQFEEVLARVRQHLTTYHQHQKLKQENRQLKDLLEGGFRELTNEDVAALVTEGESDRVEFKSTLRHNLHAGKNDKRIENACLKTVAAFLNSDGGFLLVGVDDDGNALGLEKDDFPNEDKLLLHWNVLIKQHLGVQVTPHIRSAVRSYGGKRVLIVQCLSSDTPVYFRRDNDEAFFVRTGNGTHSLKPSEVVNYINQRSSQPSTAKTADPGPSELPPTNRLGQYTLGEKLGAGGVGIVYKARHRMLRRLAAIKLLDADKANERTIERFQREVQLSSQLTHPNTITIYDYDRVADGSFYYVMELVDGLTLEQLVRKHGPQSEGRVIHLLEQVCGSLAEAHRMGLVHRDIKPANVMVCFCGGLGDFVKVLDFGLVRPIDQGEDPHITRVGDVNGTPHFMSPEAVQTPEEIDARSDVYAVGATAYYLLTGKTVFEGKSALEICLAHVNKEPRDLAEVRGTPVDEDLKAVVMRCLAKKPEERPGSALELLAELSACQAAGSWSHENAEDWWAG